VVDSDGATSAVANRNVVVNALPIANINILNEQRENGQKRTVPLADQRFVFTARALPAIRGEAPAAGCPAVGATPASPGSSDPGGSIATYEWDLNDDGVFEVNTGSAPDVARPNGYPAGERAVRLRVTDNDGGQATTRLPFRVNTAPTTQFVYEPLFPIIGQQVTFGSTSSDPDPADAGKLTHSWDLDNDGIFCEAGETGASVRRAFPTANVNPGHPVTLRVTDDGGITRPAIRNVIVQNTVPTGSISFAPGAPLPGQPVTFTGSVSSPRAIARMEWDFNFDRSSGQFDVEATGGSVSRAFPTPGPKTVALRIHEAGGGFAIVDPATVTVNAPPQAGFHVAPENAFVGDSVTLSSTSFDSDGSLPRQEWDLDNDGQFDDANAAVVSARFGRPGTYPLKLRVTDSRGASSVASGQVVVRTRPIPPPSLLNGVVVTLDAVVYRKFTKVRGLLVRAPKGSKVTVRCLGKGCPKRLTKISKGSKQMRFKRLQRNFKPRRKLVIAVTRNGFIGKQTSFTIRRRKVPLRRDLCLNPGAKKASPCPSG
jgi:PKD repeat protein